MICSSWPVPSVVDDQRLGFAAGEQAEPCARGSTPDFGHNRANRLGVATVDAHAGVQDTHRERCPSSRTSSARHQSAQSSTMFRGASLVARLDSSPPQPALAVTLIGRTQTSRFAAVAARSPVSGAAGHVDGLLGAIFCQVDDHVDHSAGVPRGQIHRAEHDFFRRAACLTSTINTPSWVPATIRSRSYLAVSA